MSSGGPQRELQQVTSQLIAEFGDRIAVATIVRVAREEVLLFDRAKVRDFVVIIALRLARYRLAEGPGRPRLAINHRTVPASLSEGRVRSRDRVVR